MAAPQIERRAPKAATLRTHLVARGRLSPDEALSIFVPVMRQLAAAHELGLVHGGLCPEAIVAITQAPEDDGRFALQAFGRPLEAEALAYLAPEQAEASDEPTPQHDVWAVGVMLFEALAGVHPFASGSAPVILVRVLTEVAPALSQTWPEAPRALSEIVERALRPDPSGRPPSMDAFLELLADAAARDGLAPR